MSIDSVHADIGGEGRYTKAINLNRWSTIRTTTQPVGTPIPNLVRGSGEELPFANRIAGLITVENTPISGQIAAEMARVVKPNGRIRLLSPVDYAMTRHQRVIDSIGANGIVRQSIDNLQRLTTLIVVKGSF